MSQPGPVPNRSCTLPVSHALLSTGTAPMARRASHVWQRCQRKPMLPLPFPAAPPPVRTPHYYYNSPNFHPAHRGRGWSVFSLSHS